MRKRHAPGRVVLVLLLVLGLDSVKIPHGLLAPNTSSLALGRTLTRSFDESHRFGTVEFPPLFHYGADQIGQIFGFVGHGGRVLLRKVADKRKPVSAATCGATACESARAFWNRSEAEIDSRRLPEG